MRKILILTAASLLFASTAFAGATLDCTLDDAHTGKTLYAAKTSGSASTAGPGQKMIGKTSTGVSIGIRSDVTGYAVVSQHKNGIKAYGSSHDSTAMFMADATAGTPLLAKPSVIGSADFVASGSVWSSM